MYGEATVRIFFKRTDHLCKLHFEFILHEKKFIILFFLSVSKDMHTNHPQHSFFWLLFLVFFFDIYTHTQYIKCKLASSYYTLDCIMYFYLLRVHTVQIQKNLGMVLNLEFCIKLSHQSPGFVDVKDAEIGCNQLVKSAHVLTPPNIPTPTTASFPNLLQRRSCWILLGSLIVLPVLFV